MADDSNLPSPGDVLAGKYRIERLIGRGGMGAVFAAHHMLLNQRVAVKLLLGELEGSEEATNRFMNEARAAAQVHGEHVARVLDIARLPTGAPYMVLEYLEGSDLSGLLRGRGVLSVPEVADYVLQALDALAQAHAAGIIHRDLKPANLFLAKRHDGTSVVKVLDFGISKNLSPVDGTPQGMTQTRALLGSPQYMSPEQLRTPRAVDARTDIWSMGVILYELLTGHMPFAAESLGELLLQIMQSTPVPVRSHRADIPAALEAAVMRCLNRDRDARFANVGELAAAIRVFASDPMRALLDARSSSQGLGSTGHVVAAAPRTAPGNTAAPWANTRQPGGLLAGNRSKVAVIVAASVVCTVVAFAGAVALLKRGAAADGALATSPRVAIDTTVTSSAIPAALPTAPNAAPSSPSSPTPPEPAHDVAAVDAMNVGAATVASAPHVKLSGTPPPKSAASSVSATPPAIPPQSSSRADPGFPQVPGHWARTAWGPTYLPNQPQTRAYQGRAQVAIFYQGAWHWVESPINSWPLTN